MECFRFLHGKLELSSFMSAKGVQIQRAKFVPHLSNDPANPNESEAVDVNIYIIGVAMVPRKHTSDSDRRLASRYHDLEDLCEIQFIVEFPYDSWPGRGLYSFTRDEGYVYFGVSPQSPAAMAYIHHRMTRVMTGKAPLEIVSKE